MANFPEDVSQDDWGWIVNYFDSVEFKDVFAF